MTPYLFFKARVYVYWMGAKTLFSVKRYFSSVFLIKVLKFWSIINVGYLVLNFWHPCDGHTGSVNDSLVLRDCRQITFVTLNGFCLLSKTPTRPPHVLNGQNQMKIHALFTLYIFQVLKVLLINISKMQPLDLLFFVAFISFLPISRYHFSQIIWTSFNIIWRIDFGHKFSFFNGFTQTPSP